MNRPIKYQAWQQYAEQMYEVVGLRWSAAIPRKFSKIELLSMDGLYTAHTVTGAACDNYVLREYTGLKDKNGKDIYEGDIVTLRYVRHKWHETRAVYWDEEKACFGPFHHFVDVDARWMDIDYTAEIIGNIYENSEPVKKEE